MRHFGWFLNHVCPGPLNKNASPTKVTVLEEMIRMMYVSVLVVHLRVWRSLLTDFSLRKLMTLPIGTKILDKYSRFFLLSVQLFPFHPTKCHTAKISILQTDWLALFGFFTSNICAMKKTLIFQWVNHHFSRQKNLQTFLTPIKFLFSKSQIFCTKIIKNHKTCVSISSMSRLEN